MKKTILFLLPLMLLPMVARAHDFYVDGIYYNIINDNEVAVTFRGTSFNSYREYSEEIIIPETVSYYGKTYTVTSIGALAFGDCPNLTSVTIPNTVISIGGSAFTACDGLSNVTIPNSVTSIGGYAFHLCSGLIDIIIPNSVESIGSNAFIGTPWYDNQPAGLVYAGLVLYKYKGSMPSGTSITIEEGTLGISGSAFENCTGLTNIIIPNSVKSIGTRAFSGCCNLANIIIASDNQYYDSRDNCNALIETATNTLVAGCKNSFIPNSVMSIAPYAFNECSSLTSIEIPNSVTFIGERAFYQCLGLTSLDIPNSVTYIGDYAFNECRGLKSLVFPSSVTATGSYVFGNCLGLKIVEIPISATCINGSTFYNPRYSTLFISGDGDWQANGINGDPANAALYIGKDVTGLKGLRTPTQSDVYSYAINPPICDDNTFSISNYSVTLHVPAASLAAYFTAEYWSNFDNIIGDAIEPEDITISNEFINLQLEDDPINLNAIVHPANATPNNIIWISTNTAVAIVNNGTVTARGPGECDIIAQCLNKKALCHVVVNDTTVTIILDQHEAMLLPNHMLILTPSASPLIPEGYTVSSSDPSVAAARLVNNRIQVVGIKEGTTTITVGSVDGTAIPATCLVTVYTEPGDMNCDGFVNISDVTSLIDYLLSGDDSQISTKNADVNGDESINISDVTELIDILLRGD